MSKFLFFVQIAAYFLAFLLLHTVTANLFIIAIAVLTSLGLDVFIFRFQRTTLGIAKMMGASGIQNVGNIQSYLTPNFFGLLGWINIIFGAVAFTLLVSNFNWVFGIIYIIIRILGISVIDFITPVPTYDYCFRVIEKHIKTEARNRKSLEMLAVSAQITDVLEEARKLNKLGRFKG